MTKLYIITRVYSRNKFTDNRRIWDRSTYGNVDGKHFGMTSKKWDGSTYRNVDGEILETGTRDYL